MGSVREAGMADDRGIGSSRQRLTDRSTGGRVGQTWNDEAVLRQIPVMAHLVFEFNLAHLGSDPALGDADQRDTNRRELGFWAFDVTFEGFTDHIGMLRLPVLDDRLIGDLLLAVFGRRDRARSVKGKVVGRLETAPTPA